MRRGDVFWATLPPPVGRRPVVLVSRDEAYAIKTRVTVVVVTRTVRGIPTEVSPSAAKFGKQIRYAERRGIPYVWFPGEGGDSVKDIRSGEQVDADPYAWEPPAGDRFPVATGPVS